MARPTKQCVEYFSHDTVGGKTLFTLETQYGNDGYAFWFKLLELLGTQDGLYYDCNNKANWMFLISRARIDEDTALKILNTLSDLEAIDVELWQDKLIWCQNYVNRLKDLFDKRKCGLPKKPEFTERKPHFNRSLRGGNPSK